MKAAALLIGAALAVVARGAGAQIAPPSGQAPARGPGAAQVCAGCHGLRGAGNPSGGVPRIAGLSQYYSAQQLESYANGTRRHPAMEAIARSLSPRDAAVVTAYFARVDAPAVRSPVPTTPRAAAERGRLLATVGSAELRVQACDNCHGPDGGGQPPNIPYLSGQDATYLMATLHAWRAGTRRNDAGGQMEAIAQALTPEAIEAVARHYATRSPPPPRPLALVRAPPRARQPVAGEGVAPAPPAARAEPAGAAVQRLSPAELRAADPARGRAILAGGTHGCAACHALPGVRGANGVVGPPLGGMARRGFIAGQLPNRLDVLVAFLLDPPALVPRTGMPATGLTPEEALHVAAYLNTLGH